jgi:hypothetical protein
VETTSVSESITRPFGRVLLSSELESRSKWHFNYYRTDRDDLLNVRSSAGLRLVYGDLPKRRRAARPK